MLPKENPEEFYSRFHEQLLNSQDWPGVYLFKFILREGEVKEQVLKDMFTQKEAVFSKKASSKKTFTSLSVKVTMEDPDAVIAIYKDYIYKSIPKNYPTIYGSIAIQFRKDPFDYTRIRTSYAYHGTTVKRD